MRWERQSGLWANESMNVEGEMVLVVIEFDGACKIGN